MIIRENVKEMKVNTNYIDKTLDNVKNICKKHHFTYHETVNGIYIKTNALAGWYIMLTESIPKLYHESYRNTHRYGKGILENYHRHKDIKETTPEGMLDYIIAHDKKMMNIKRSKKQ